MKNSITSPYKLLAGASIRLCRVTVVLFRSYNRFTSRTICFVGACSSHGRKSPDIWYAEVWEVKLYFYQSSVPRKLRHYMKRLRSNDGDGDVVLYQIIRLVGLQYAPRNTDSDRHRSPLAVARTRHR